MDNPLNINLNEGNRTDKRKPSQFDQSFIANILSGCSNSVVHTKDELMEYEAEELEPSNCGPDGILLYWAQRSRKWPRLSCMARDILTIPTTSASSERAFIVGKDVYFVAELRMNYKNFLKSMATKIIERSPIKYPLVRYISCLSPLVIQQDCEVARRRMEKLGRHLIPN
ncbi:Uncharacterized protein APZ42_024981 [Daphnia magna]|uniref:HAT C-terminal dimerisation domain-containing protein n=1 Tax=Daphnia magna TaxID=35525 RepID=A0A164TKQ5_9CRUS|nr:Uncharacterized protein APZ42_024981 [Daphnia magna]